MKTLLLRRRTAIALLALIPATTARLQPSQRCRKLHAGGANAFGDWQRSFRRDAPITYALAALHLMTFVASTRPRLRRGISGHAVCCRRALQMRRFHSLVAHAIVTGTPSQLGFGLLALYLVAKPVETSAGSQRFARFALASIIAGGCATAVSQSLGASGGVTGCVEIKMLPPRRPPRHRRDTCSMAWRCRFLAARSNGRVIAAK